MGKRKKKKKRKRGKTRASIVKMLMPCPSQQVFEECIKQAVEHKTMNPSFLDEALGLFPDR
eukprot:scaffold194_cov277-Pinguiococcus_pyrenoidosus.AAC.4